MMYSNACRMSKGVEEKERRTKDEGRTEGEELVLGREGGRKTRRKRTEIGSYFFDEGSAGSYVPGRHSTTLLKSYLCSNYVQDSVDVRSNERESVCERISEERGRTVEQNYRHR